MWRLYQSCLVPMRRTLCITQVSSATSQAKGRSRDTANDRIEDVKLEYLVVG